MSFSDYFENAVLNHIFGHSIYTFQGHWFYIGLGLNTTDADANELVEQYGYARVATMPSDWKNCINGATTNAEIITFPEVVDGDWGIVSHFLIFDTPVVGTGNMLMYGAFTDGRNKTIEEGSIPKFEIDDLECNID